MEIILFVGSNPSQTSTVDCAFHSSTKSSRILTSWTKDIVGMKQHINVLNKKTDNNRALNTAEINSSLDRLREEIRCVAPTKIVALGKTATKVLTLLQVSFYEMPHPSPRNRLLNDAVFVEGKIKGLVEYCNPTSPQISD